MVFSVLLLDIALLLLPLSVIEGCKTEAKTNLAMAAPVSAKPLMTGVRFASLDGQQQLFVLQIDSLELIGKTLGPFELEDQQDISAINCFLRSDSAALSANIREMEKFLFPMMKSLKTPTSQPASASSPKSDVNSVSYKAKLVGLPPTVKARPFTCAISQPQGPETNFQADLATFDPLQTDISLEGKVKVQVGDQTCLTAENIIWRVIPRELSADGAYRFQTGEREVKGQDGRFSLSGGGLEPIKTQALPGLRELPVSAPIAPLMMPPSSTGSRSRKKTILSQVSRTLLQGMGAAVAAQEQRLTAEQEQGKAAALAYPKPQVFPPAPMTHSMEETVNRELFAEKSR